MTFKPNLAGTVTKPDLLKFPLYASPKIDGVRAIVINGKFISRTGKLIPNLYIQSRVPRDWEGLDGELVSGPDNAPDVFNKTQSAVMTIKGEPHVQFKAFDIINNNGFEAGYADRYGMLEQKRCYYIIQQVIYTISELDVFEHDCLEAGYEGVMLRDPYASYKNGRSTEREGGLLKLKRFVDAEAVILECVRGEGKYAGTLGALRVQHGDMIFNVGSGLTDHDRFEIWADPDAVIGKQITYKSFLVGVKDLPRFPTFKGFRNSIDF